MIQMALPELTNSMKSGFDRMSVQMKAKATKDNVSCEVAAARLESTKKQLGVSLDKFRLHLGKQ
jgi:hypothetical protein